MELLGASICSGRFLKKLLGGPNDPMKPVDSSIGRVGVTKKKKFAYQVVTMCVHWEVWVPEI